MGIDSAPGPCCGLLFCSQKSHNINVEMVNKSNGIKTQNRLPLADEDAPFANDLFNRKDLAERLTGYVGMLKQGSVFAIQADWGEGKTWFAKNWEAQLKKEDFKTIYLDAFKNDFGDDPFLLISGKILGFSKENGEKSDVRTEITRLMRDIANDLTRPAASYLLTFIDTDSKLWLVYKFICLIKIKIFKRKIKNRLEAVDSQEAKIKHLKNSLSKIASSQDKPIVFFIDELDRCRPDFAVKLIERIKHFFDVPGFVFVLMVNWKQLEASVKGVYGESIEANTYLGKFVHFSLELPKDTTFGSQENFLQKYCAQLAERHGLDLERPEIQQFVDIFALFAGIYGLSLRDLENGFIIFLLSKVDDKNYVLMAFLISLKIKHPGLFYGILNKNHGIIREADKTLLNVSLPGNSDAVGCIQSVRILLDHLARGQPIPTIDSMPQNAFSDRMISRVYDRQNNPYGTYNPIHEIASYIDLTVSVP